MSATLLRCSTFLMSPFRTLRFCVVLLLITLNTTNATAQVNSYAFTSTTGIALETGPFTNLLGTFLDDDVSSVANIGFTFRFGGINYTNFSVTSNGLMQLGGSAATDYNNSMASLSGPYLIPYWDDNYTDANGNAQYKLMGVAGSRKLVVEYNLSYLGNTGAADKRFQVWLFETSNKVQFVYGAGNNLNGGFTIGILTSSSDYKSVTTASHTSSIAVAQNNNTTWPGSGRSYSFTVGSTLPVSLVNFNGHKDGNRNLLQWSTATEINNRGFEVQRSADGNSYSNIGFVPSRAASGNSNSIINYEYSDITAIGNRYYYRLRQTDFDDRSKLSPVIVIDDRKPNALQLMGVFPNPSSSTMNVQISSPNKQMLSMRLYDMQGQLLLQKMTTVEKGSNSIPVDVNELANNIYLLKVLDANGQVVGTLKVTLLK